MTELSFTVSGPCGDGGVPAKGVRLDKYAGSVFPEMTRSRLKNGMLSVSVNGRPAKMAKLVYPGDCVLIKWEDPLPACISAEPVPLDIIYEDENVTVVNKKQGMVTHPAAGNWTGTLVNALLYRWNTYNPAADSSVPAENGCVLTDESRLRPGIVHRLDKDTSGVIIAARSAASEMWLQEQFRTRRVRKIYCAILQGIPPQKSGTVKTQLIRDPRNRKRFTWSDDPSRGKFSHTEYTCAAVYGPYSLVFLRLKTGRTHQLRVHMKYLGCPILGDPVYGRKDSLFSTATLMLHARDLGIRLPGEENISVFRAPFPRRFRKVARVLKKTYPKKVPADLQRKIRGADIHE